jgi:hypothetical protein
MAHSKKLALTVWYYEIYLLRSYVGVLVVEVVSLAGLEEHRVDFSLDGKFPFKSRT